MDNSDEINNESDNELDLNAGYHMRSKRRKLDKSGEQCTSVYRNTDRKRKNPIAYMPTEIVQAIFRFLPHHELSQNVRLVNHRFKILAEDVLNRSFRLLKKKLNNLSLLTEISLTFTQDDMEIKCIAIMLNMLAILKSQYSIVMATIWRYVFNDFYKTTKKCMYAGRLIDAYFTFIDKFFDCPNMLYAPAVIRDYYIYIFKNSWFIALPVNVSKDMEWRQRQRMMHMRIRRIVLAHNDMFLQQDQYDRELMLRPNPVLGRIKKPGNNVYTGYGDVGDTFFYYGVMNDGAYDQKFNHDDDDEEEFDDDFIGPDNNVLDLVARNNSSENVSYRIPYLGFKMNVEIKCPLSYAPLRFLKTLNDSELQKLKDKHKIQGPTHIKVVFECEGASYPRLPCRFEYDFKPTEL